MTIRQVRTGGSGSGGGTILRFNRGVFGDLKDRVGKNRLADVGVHMQHELRQVLQGRRSGRQYRLPTGGFYTASAPGEAPAKRLGDLRDSIEWELQTTTRGDMTVEVGTDKDYGMMLEMGTRNILPRPWMKVTFERQRDNIERLMSKPWN